jgi:predicted nucleotidyltransferase
MVAMGDIQAFAERIVEQFRPQRIILFGSHAYGTAGPDSDVDLLVVIPDGGRPLHKAAEIRRQVAAGFSLDLIVRDPDVLRWRIEQHDWFLKEIVEKGKVLYAAADR